MAPCKIAVLFSLYLLLQTSQKPLWATGSAGASTPFSPPRFSSCPSAEVNASKEFEELEEELNRLMEELKQFEKETEKKIRKDVLPALKKEIEKLRKWLREYYPGHEESTPI